MHFPHSDRIPSPSHRHSVDCPNDMCSRVQFITVAHYAISPPFCFIISKFIARHHVLEQLQAVSFPQF